MIRVLNLSGNAYTLGQQHGTQVADLRPQIVKAMEVRLAALRQKNEPLEPCLDEIARLWETHTPQTLAMMRGLAESLGLPWEHYFTYIIASYLTDRLKGPENADGCTAWAASGDVTADGEPLLVKNRDYRPDHQQLQCLARIKPEHGYSYLTLTSAGSPGVFSSGVNAAGLAVADTHVVSKDIGPGISRYSLMMHLLEQCDRVSQALDYMKSVPHFGDGTVVLADMEGDMAVFELAHSVQAVRRSFEGYLVSTNHFSDLQTRSLWMDTNPPRLQGNSEARRRTIENELGSSHGQVNVIWAQTQMARHGDDLSAICRHPEVEAHAVTISTVIFQPRQASLYVTNGLPCQTPFEQYSISARD